MVPRSVPTPSGSLYLAAMPGRYAPLAQDLADISALGIDGVLCLAPAEELQEKSPEYARRLGAGELPWPVEAFAIPDFGEPADRTSFAELVFRAAEALGRGDSLLVHCAAGIGRTGMTATCILIALGYDEDTARKAVSAAGSSPQGTDQSGLIRWFAQLATAPLHD